MGVQGEVGPGVLTLLAGSRARTEHILTAVEVASAVARRVEDDGGVWSDSTERRPRV